MLSIGFDIGSSSVKAALVDLSTGKSLDLVQYPKKEMSINAPHEGWAEQDPEEWWNALCNCTKKILSKNAKLKDDIKAIGISYQMHGLVLLDENNEVIRPAIIWCDSRAIEIGNQALFDLGVEYCFENLLNSPGNFTASKLKWVKENEPENFKKIKKIALPGDYIAMKFSGEINTTVSGLSEGIFWDFQSHSVSERLIQQMDFNSDLIPDIVDTFSIHGRVSSAASASCGLPENIPITYRAGDQPNNALSLGVFNPGDIAATGGTSGVVYGLTKKKYNLSDSGVNCFAHVNHTKNDPCIGQLLCINGAGSQYAWIKSQVSGKDYSDMEEIIKGIPIGTEGLRIIPFGNGAERMINNKLTGAQINNLQFNVHSQAHLIRAALEGIAFSFIYGIQLLKKLGLELKRIKVGNDNLFQSEVFSTTIANLLACDIEMKNTTGAIGAAIASGKAINAYDEIENYFANTNTIRTFRPENSNSEYEDAYRKWELDLNKLINID